MPSCRSRGAPMATSSAGTDSTERPKSTRPVSIRSAPGSPPRLSMSALYGTSTRRALPSAARSRMPRMAKKKPVRRRKKVTARSVGLSAPETADVHDAATRALASQVVADGGAALAVYREPFGGTPRSLVAALPIDRVEPTPYQRDPSEPHVKRLMTVIEKLGRFLDPDHRRPTGRRLLDAERQSPAAGDAQARCEDRSSRWSCPMPTSRSRSSRSTPRRRTTSRRSRSRRSAWLRALADERSSGDRARVRVRVRAAAVPDARRRLRAAPAPERRRLPSGAAPHR